MGWGAGCVAGTDQRPEGIPPGESSPGEEKDKLPQAQSPPQALPQGHSSSPPCVPKGWAGLVGIAASPKWEPPDSSQLPSHCPLLGGIPLLPSAHLDPREGRVLCPNPQNHHRPQAHPVTPGPKPWPLPTSPRTLTAGRPGRAPPLHCGRLPGARSGSLSSPAGQPPASPSRGTSSLLLPPDPGAGPQAPDATCRAKGTLAWLRARPLTRRGLGRGAGLDAGARRSPGRPPVARGGLMLEHQAPTPTHTHSNTLTHAHWPSLSTD